MTGQRNLLSEKSGAELRELRLLEILDQASAAADEDWQRLLLSDLRADMEDIA